MEQILTTSIKKFVKNDNNNKIQTLRNVIFFKFIGKSNQRLMKEGSIKMSDLLNNTEGDEKTIEEENRLLSKQENEEIKTNEDDGTINKTKDVTLKLKINKLNRTFDEIDFIKNNQDIYDDDEEETMIQLNRTDSDLFFEKNMKVIKVKIIMPKQTKDKGEIIEQITNFGGEKGKSILMGTKALMRKYTKRRNDADIVHKLVTENFNDFFDRYYERSYKRATLRRERFLNKGEDCNDNDEKINDYVNLEKYCKEEDEEEVVTDLDEVQSNENMEFDPEKFLKEVLDDELECYDGNISSCTTLSRTTTCSTNSSVGTSEVSALLSKNSLYSTVTKKYPKLCSTPITLTTPIYEELPDNNKDVKYFSNGKKVECLIEESSRQYQVMLQTTKALNFCKSFKDFDLEKIEAERILLIATRKREELLKEINKLDFQKDFYQNFQNFGKVFLSKVKFCPKYDVIMKTNNHFKQLFICLFCCGSTIFGTNVMYLNDETKEICFDECFEFNRLRYDFEIKIQFYNFRLKWNKKECKDVKMQTLRKCKKSTLNRIFELKKSQKNDTNRTEHLIIVKPSFKLFDELVINVNDLTKNDQSSPSIKLTNLKSEVTININYDVQMNESHVDFLTIGTESNGCILWTRRWCFLNDSKLLCWNYPNEQFEIEPIDYFDLKYCLTSKVGNADRSLCPRPKTLMIELLKKNETTNDCTEDGIIKFETSFRRCFLSADNFDDLEMWKMKINGILSCLISWKRMKS